MIIQEGKETDLFYIINKSNFFRKSYKKDTPSNGISPKEFDDKTIPIENSRKLKNIFKSSILKKILNSDHGFTGKVEDVAKMVSNWLGSLI